MGEYKPTELDQLKKEVDFRILSISPVCIRWKDGKTETVNKRQLAKLQKSFVWTTDF